MMPLLDILSTSEKVSFSRAFAVSRSSSSIAARIFFRAVRRLPRSSRLWSRRSTLCRWAFSADETFFFATNPHMRGRRPRIVKRPAASSEHRWAVQEPPIIARPHGPSEPPRQPGPRNLSSAQHPLDDQTTLGEQFVDLRGVLPTRLREVGTPSAAAADDRRDFLHHLPGM